MGGDAPKGVLLALAIVLFWLAGVAFFVALEGSTVMGQAAPAPGGGGGSYIRSIIAGLAQKAGTGSTSGGSLAEGTAPGPITGSSG